MLETDDAPDVTVDQFGRTLVLTMENQDAYGHGPVYIYESGSYSYLTYGLARHLSADGTTVAGSMMNADEIVEAARWTVGGGTDMLGALPDALSCPSISSGYALTGDGSTVVGLSWEGCSARGFTWTADGGMTDLENLGNGNNRASVISDDGQVIAGFAQGTFNRTPAVWNASDSSGWLFDIDAQGEIGAMNSDGSILGGRYYDENVGGDLLQPFYWTAEQGVIILPAVPGYDGGYVTGFSADGRTIVGYSGTIFGGRVAAVWRAEWGAVALADKLAELGAPVPADFLPQVIRAVTDDGRTVVGWGLDLSSAETRAFIATLPEQVDPTCAEDLDADGVVGFTDLTQLLGTWGSCAGCPEDLDGDGQVGFTDLTQLLGNWGPCL
jgi:uncharacterized membrane protein